MANAWDQRLNESDADHRALMRWLEQGPERPPPNDPAAQVHDWARRCCAYDLAHSVPKDPKEAVLQAYLCLAQTLCVNAQKMLALALEDPSVDPKETRKLAETVAKLPALAQGLPTERHVHLHGLPPELERQIDEISIQLAASGLLLEEPRK